MTVAARRIPPKPRPSSRYSQKPQPSEKISAMTFSYLSDNDCSPDRPHSTANIRSQESRPSLPSFLFLASTFVVLIAASVFPTIAQAADEPPALNSISISDPSASSNSISSPIAGLRAFNENEFLPVTVPPSGPANPANASPTIFKPGRWSTNKAVIAASIFEAAWLSADGITTVRIGRGASEAGSAWAYGNHPTAGRTAAMMTAEFVGVEASSFMLHKMKAPKWIYLAPMLVSGSLHASGAIPNLKIGQ
jgi:hypothetical protein